MHFIKERILKDFMINIQKKFMIDVPFDDII